MSNATTLGEVLNAGNTRSKIFTLFGTRLHCCNRHQWVMWAEDVILKIKEIT